MHLSIAFGLNSKYLSLYMNTHSCTGILRLLQLTTHMSKMVSTYGTQYIIYTCKEIIPFSLQNKLLNVWK